jgi:hypothetical protein
MWAYRKEDRGAPAVPLRGQHIGDPPTELHAHAHVYDALDLRVEHVARPVGGDAVRIIPPCAAPASRMVAAWPSSLRW